MADTVTFQTTVATPASGTVIATDDCGAAGHAQIVKLGIATDGSATAIPADANGLTVKQGTAAQLNCTEASASAIKTAVEIMDDWDESDRAKVNPIVGQAGVAAGAGAVGATVQRVTLASDDPAVTALQILDDIVKAEDAAHSSGDKGVMVLAVRNDAHATLAADGDYIPLSVDSSGDLHVSIQNNASVVVASALPAGTNNIGDVDVLSIAAGDNNIGNVDIVTVPADPFGANADAAATAGSTGSMQAKFRLMTSQLDSIKTAVETIDNAISGSEMQVDIVGALPAGTNAIGKLAANSGVDIGDVDVTSVGGNVTVVQATASNMNAQVVGEVAHDGADSGNPVKIGGKATTDMTGLTAVANADRAQLLVDTLGRPIVMPYAPHENLVRGSTSDITDTTRTSVIAAGAANVKTYITHILVMNSHASQGTWVNIEDGTTTKYTIFAASGGGGASCTLPVPIAGTAATAWNVSCGTTGANVRVSMSGYQCKV